jgi:hypothetical protein
MVCITDVRWKKLPGGRVIRRTANSAARNNDAAKAIAPAGIRNCRKNFIVSSYFIRNWRLCPDRSAKQLLQCLHILGQRLTSGISHAV